MPCTTILVGKKASHDGSTMIARTDDGHYDVKRLEVTVPKSGSYTSVIGHLTLPLPENGLRFTYFPSVDRTHGIWGAAGINEVGVGMTATETITTNTRVLAADPLVRYRKAVSRREKEQPGGIGEEDLLLLVLPYIRSAREGVERLASLLETYGTYESNGIAFNDGEEVWWLETIGGHHWIACRVRDEEVVLMPNQFGLDRFDFRDARGEGRDYLCSRDLEAFVRDNALDLGQSGTFNPRNAFGSRTDHDHIYNTPRGWYMARYLCPTGYRWDGPDAEFTPESDNLPWAVVPEKKVCVEDIKYLLSSHYQGTPYDPYSPVEDPRRGMYRTIGINRTGDTAICQIRGWMPTPLKGVEWLCFGPTTYVTMLPVYTYVDKIPAYLSQVTEDVSTDNFYWSSRLLAALADPYHHACVQKLDYYEREVVSRARALLGAYDARVLAGEDPACLKEANEAICRMAREETTRVMNRIVLEATARMQNRSNRYDL